MQTVVAAGAGTTPAAFYLGLCRLRGILSPPASATVILQAGRCHSAQLRWCCRRAVLSCSSDDAASIPKSGPEIKNRCSLWAVLEGFFASIPKFGPEIKNRCTQEGLNREILASILKSGPEIKNRCRKQPIFSTHPQHIPQHIPSTSPAHPPARVHHALKTRLALVVLHGGGHDAGSAVAAKSGADAPRVGISLCFCRRGCAAPA